MHPKPRGGKNQQSYHLTTERETWCAVVENVFMMLCQLSNSGCCRCSYECGQGGSDFKGSCEDDKFCSSR